jgi:hypothetical protein
MLPAGSARVPGGLRYTIARALLDVDVPPFDSLEDFSETLTRYERGPRDQIVRRLLQRLDARRGLVPASAADRRRHPHATALRRALREADARLYLQKVATEALTVTVTPRPARPRRVSAAAACVAAGLVLIVAGEFLDGWQRPLPAMLLATRAANVVARDIALAPEERRPSKASSGSELVEGTVNVEPRTANAEPRPLSVKRAVRVQTARERARKASSSRGVLDRLRLNWLRTVFASS